MANYQEIAVKWKISAWIQIGGCFKGFLYALLGMIEGGRGVGWGGRLMRNDMYGEAE